MVPAIASPAGTGWASNADRTRGDHMANVTNRTWINVTTLGDMIGQRAEEHPDREAVVFPTDRHTYAQIEDLAQHYARGLLALEVGPQNSIGLSEWSWSGGSPATDDCVTKMNAEKSSVDLK